jgi:hypothetical protein
VSLGSRSSELVQKQQHIVEPLRFRLGVPNRCAQRFLELTRTESLIRLETLDQKLEDHAGVVVVYANACASISFMLLRLMTYSEVEMPGQPTMPV